MFLFAWKKLLRNRFFIAVFFTFIVFSLVTLFVVYNAFLNIEAFYKQSFQISRTYRIGGCSSESFTGAVERILTAFLRRNPLGLLLFFGRRKELYRCVLRGKACMPYCTEKTLRKKILPSGQTKFSFPIPLFPKVISIGSERRF